MGANQSVDSTGHELGEDLNQLKKIVTKLVDDKDMFIDREYNFLSEDVCDKYKVILESDLDKLLKLEIKSLGESLLLIPTDEENKLLQRKNIAKKDICSKIANHYIRILYVLCLVKYVYNIERHGELSLAGIVFRNIRVNKSTVQVEFCKESQKNLRESSGSSALALNFARLEGFRFFTKYFLDRDEATVFLRTFRHLLSRKPKGTLRKDLCEFKKLKELEDMYKRRFGEDLKCLAGGSSEQPDNTNAATTEYGSGDDENPIEVMVEGDNPIFDRLWCYRNGVITIPLAESDGKQALDMIKEMKSRYKSNIKDVEKILYRLVKRKLDGSWTLNDITKTQLDSIVADVKDKIKVFYIQSICDFQDFLDRIKTFPHAIIV